MRTPLIMAATVSALALACDGSVDAEDEIVCSTQFTIAGSAVLETKPAEIGGCWPVGTWTFTLTQTANSCATAPTPLAQYQMKVERDLAAPEPDHTYNYTFLTDPTDMTVELGTTSGGGGLCEGEILIFADGGNTVWNLHPALQADNTLNGLGDYEQHTTNQIPQE